MADRRILTLTPAAIMVVANMVGTGVFTTTGLMAGMGAAGGDILLAWLMGGTIAVCGALCYGEVGANLPHSGGEYHYLSRLLHPAVGFMSGIVSIVVGFAAPIAAAAIALNLYVSTVVPWWPVHLAAAATVLVLALLHAYDLRLGSRFQVTITSMLVALILIFIVGILSTRPTGGLASLLDIHPSFLLSSPFAVVLIYVSLTYAGWNAAAYIGAELKHPERTLPRSLVIGTVSVTVLYMFLNLSFLLVVPANELAGIQQVGYLVAGRLWGNGVADVVSILIAVMLLCQTSAMLIIGPRVPEAMARDGFLFTGLARLNGRKVPYRAVALMALLAAVIALPSSLESLLVYIGFVLNIFAALTVVSLFRLRRERRSRIKICVGYPITPIIFLVFTIWMTAWSIRTEPVATLAGLATLFVGYLLYLLRAKEASLATDPS